MFLPAIALPEFDLRFRHETAYARLYPHNSIPYTIRTRFHAVLRKTSSPRKDHEFLVGRQWQWLRPVEDWRDPTPIYFLSPVLRFRSAAREVPVPKKSAHLRLLART